MAPLESGHGDFIQDVAYGKAVWILLLKADYYAARLATCSSDCKINVFNRAQETDSWVLSASWIAHDAAVLRVSWAHPQHGQVLASCSIDRTIRIWRETVHEWTEKARLLDSRAPILQVAFAPPHLGLKLASIAGDAIVRIYETTNPESLSKWTLREELSTVPPHAPPQHSGESSFSLSWCPSRLGGQQLVIAANNLVQLYRPDDRGAWQAAETVQEDGGLVRSVAWAPGGQRGYELIATGSKTGVVRVWRLEQRAEGVEIGGGCWECRLVMEQVQGGAGNEVWRVEWNGIGTVLSSSGDDGRVRLWKEDHFGRWKQDLIVSAEEIPEDPSQDVMHY